jgi:hypothetical protein
MPTRSSLLQRNSSLEISHLPLDQLTPLPGAPRRHPKNQIRSLKASIEAFGFNVPVLVDQHNQIVSGHARVAALRELGFVTVPVIRLEHLDENAVRAFMVADNRLSELSDWDEAICGSRVSAMPTPMGMMRSRYLLARPWSFPGISGSSASTA